MVEVRRRSGWLWPVVVLVAGCQLALPPGAPRKTTGSLTAAGTFHGVLMTGEGKPAVGVAISAFIAGSSPLTTASPLIGNSGSGLVGNSGSGLVGNSGSGLMADMFRIQDIASPPASLSTTTDASGAFTLASPVGGVFNFEGKASPTSNAWRLEVPLATGSVTEVTGMRLCAPGTIKGHVTIPASPSADPSGILVFIYGSEWLTTTDASGDYTLSGVSAGRFRIGAHSARFGDATYPPPGADPIKLATGSVTIAPDLSLSASP